jgi:hypothetical protein
MDLNHIDQAILANYRNLRTRIGILAFAFPVILILVGYFWSISLQATLSNYYFAADPVSTRIDHTPVRLWFCGILFVVSFFLYRYRGFSKNEDRWLSLAGLFALGVAIFPMSMDGQDAWGWVLAWIGLTQFSLHYICAVLAFGCIGVVIVWYADSTLSELKDSNPSAYRQYKIIYSVIAVFMVVSILISIFLNYRSDGKGSFVLLAETCGIWSFAAYWFVKNSEMTMVGRALKARKATLPQRTAIDLADRL